MKSKISMNKIHDITLGADVELCLVKNNRLFCVGDYVDKDSKFGLDAHGKKCTLEIRTDISKEPKKIVDSIRDVLQSGLNEFPEFNECNWVAGSFVKNLPLGFHFHNSHELGLIEPDNIACYYDDYVGSISLLLEDKSQGLKRRAYTKTPAGTAVSYGKASDIRIKDYKKICHYEYRTISGGVLSTPEICLAFISLFKIVAHEIINNPNLRYKKYVSNDDFVNMNSDKIYAIFPSIWNDITQMALYNKYKKNLNIILSLIKHKESWTLKNIDLKKAWNLSLDINAKSKPSFKQIWDDYQVLVNDNKINNNLIIEKKLEEQDKNIFEFAKDKATPLKYVHIAPKIPKINNNKKIKVVKKIIKAKKKVNPVIHELEKDLFYYSNAPIYLNDNNEYNF